MYINSIEHTKTYLRRVGYEIIDQDKYEIIDRGKQHKNARPYLILWDRRKDEIVYVDLRIWESPPEYRPRRWWKNWMHRRKVKSAFNEWLRINKWRGKHRYDVIEVYPPIPPIRGDGRPVIDHIVDVKM